MDHINVNKFCILDTFAGLPLVNDWTGFSNSITVLEAGTFKLKAGDNYIDMNSNGLHTVHAAWDFCANTNR